MGIFSLIFLYRLILYIGVGVPKGNPPKGPTLVHIENFHVLLYIYKIYETNQVQDKF
jgi:hypothetical protein